MAAKYRIKELMEARGMTQNGLARKAGISQSGISTILSGKARPREDSMEAIARALECSIADLYEEEKAPPQEETGSGEDDDTWALRERLRRDPDMRVLFSAAEKATPEHIRAAAAMLKALKGEDDD